MFCLKCGTDLPDGSQFCRKCGQSQSIATATTSSGAASAVAPARIPAPKSKRSTAMWRLVPFLLVVAVWAIWEMNAHGYYGTSNTSHPQLQQQPQPQLHMQSTADVAFTVNAGGSNRYKFTVAAGAYDVKLKGRFAATGGLGNDIEVYVLSEDDYVNWQNGHSVHTFYNSGKITQDNVNVVLPSDAGTYYVVFDNRYSLLTPKAVQANVSLTYYTH